MKKILLLAVTMLALTIPKSYASDGFLENGNFGSEPGYVYKKVDKRADSNELKNEIVPYFVPWDFNRKLDVPYRQQITNYYCGPACVQMVCDYYKLNTSRTQHTYAKDLGTNSAIGTYGSRIPAVLNKYISSYKYDYYQGDHGFQDFLDSAYYTIKNRAPVIINMRSNHLSSSAWPYKISGHFVVLSSMRYDSGKKKFVGDIKDPWYRSPKQYQVTYPQIYEVMMKHNQAMIY
ncbi:C39 family peptidase [uncultured Anaerococcus sp.]|uniref:C39 family peptidase n=1 Tax=uncultured Anaerococcus sp. TaxID=293428 RepID=UPI0025D2FEA1|nr:C39 family peptidase [uncultured Anaerococcus sp.]